jgi:hypothetical protein
LLTLNQIISQITDLANAHYQIAEVGTGTLAELQSKPDRLYPLLWLSNEGGSLDQNYKIDNIRLTMFGRVIAGEEGQDDDASELEVLSDMQLILLDFLNYFHQQHGQEYVTDKAATLEHFTERTNDRTAGYSCVLELKQFYDWNKCQIPQSGASIPPSVDGLTLYDFCDQATIDRLTATQVACLEAEFGNCADATVQLNGTTVGTVASGGTDSFPVTQGGSPVGSWNGSAWIVPPCVNPSLTIGVYSDAGLTNPITTANFDDTIYIKLTATDITPTLYRFYVSANGVTSVELFEQAGNTLAYNVFGLQDVVIYAESTDGSSIAAALTNTTITVTDTNADAFIAAHNALTSLSMGSVQQQCVQDTYRMLKGSNTPNGNDLFSYHTANANTRFFPLIPVDDSTVNIAGYTLDIFHLATGSYSGFVIGDFSVNGVTGGNTKYFNSGVSPSSLPIDNISCAIYSRTNFNGFDADFGATDVANSLNNSVRCETNNNFTMRFSLNDSTNSSVSVIDSLGLRILNRVSTIKKGLDLNNLFGFQYAVATTSSPTATTYFHFINGYTTSFYYSRRQLCLYWQALGMTQAQIEDWRFIINHIQETVITGGRDV